MKHTFINIPLVFLGSSWRYIVQPCFHIATLCTLGCVGCVSENLASLCPAARVHVTMPMKVWRKPFDHYPVHFPAVDCGPLADPVNGVVMVDRGTTFGMAARYSCNAGYMIADGAFGLRLCTISGQWSGEAPRCERMYTIQQQDSWNFSAEGIVHI